MGIMGGGKEAWGLGLVFFDWVAGTAGTAKCLLIGRAEENSLPEMLPRNAFRGAVPVRVIDDDERSSKGSVTGGEVADGREDWTARLTSELQLAIAAIPRVGERQGSLEGGLYNAFILFDPREMASASVSQ